MSRRRRLGLMVAGVMFVVLVAVGIQSWRVVSAIVDAERAAVVPLPTRDNEIAFGGSQNLTPSPTAAAESTQIAKITPTAAPNVTVAIHESASSGDGPSPTPQPTVESTAIQTVAATTSPTSQPEPTQEADSPSRLDVIRQVVQAGIGSGDPGTSEIWGGKTELNILVLGVDRRSSGGDQNADVIIIAHLDLINKRLAAVSIPRDLLVDIPEVGLDKINGAYNYGVLAHPNDLAAGVAKVRDTIEYQFGVPIDSYVLLDFEGFQKVVDSVGGIDINVPQAIHDGDYPTEDFGTEVVDFAQGEQHMDGDLALKYVRTRHSDSDDGRRERQRQVLLALFAKGKGVSSATRADNMIVALGDSIQTSFPLEQQLTLARIALEMKDSDITMTSLSEPLLQAGQTPDGRWAYVGDMNQIVAFIRNSLVFEQSTPTAD